MTTLQFILSNNRKTAIIRHLVFWGIFCMVAFISTLAFESIGELRQMRTFKISLMHVICFIPSYILTVYVFTHLLIPRFIQKKKYIGFALMAILTILLIFIINIWTSQNFVLYAYPDLPKQKFSVFWSITDYNASIQRGFLIAGAATALKLTKGWYIQQIENTKLAKQEADYRTWLFKSQMQPEFLFHSLKSLHGKIVNAEEDAPGMILNLSDIFSYILYECNGHLIELEKELTAVGYLLKAEKMNDSGRSDFSIHVTGSQDNKYIIPLSLFSFVRNLLETGPKNNSGSLLLKIEENQIDFSVQINTNFSADSIKKDILQALPENFREYKRNDNPSKNYLSFLVGIELTNMPAEEMINEHQRELTSLN